jgi:hypothetical protein
MAAVHLIIGQCGLVRRIFASKIMQLTGFPVIAPKAFALCGQPQVALAVFIDVDDDGISLPYTDKTIFLVIVQA